MSVTVVTTDDTRHQTSAAEMTGLSGGSFSASDRVPGIAGEGLDFAAWHAALTAVLAESMDKSLPAPTHLIVRAADEFEAVIPWNQLEGAFFLFSVDGAPLAKGGPLRLYVPDGTSACLNVKNVTFIRFASEPERGAEAAYGFRNEITPARLLQGFRAGD